MPVHQTARRAPSGPPAQPTELRVSDMPRALDTYLGLSYDVVSVADGCAVLHSGEEGRTIALRSANL